ncbi:MAG: hypothetical protein ACRDKT_10795 [Actinomycetota bacterium]
MRRRAFALMVVVVVTAALMTGTGSAARERDDRRRHVGLLVVDHGEPPEYNELTYWSFRKFFDHLIEMGLIPAWLRALDEGTVLQDTACYGCNEPSTDPTLIDAWLHPHDEPAVYHPASDSLPAYYAVPGGPGLGEPDIFEHVGLGAWHEWNLMGGTSPNFGQKLPKKRFVIDRVRELYGDDLPIRIGYGIDPRIDGRHMDVRKAVVGLVNRDRVDEIVVAYHGVGFSDIMQTHMLRHEIHEIIEELGADVDVSYTDPIGTSSLYVRSVVEEVERELSRLPDGAPVAVHLSGHGLGTDMCGDYDCGADAYHRYSKQLFERTSSAIDESLSREGRTGIFHLYGDGATEEDDPEDKVDSPMEALAERKKAGFEYVVDIPHEFDSDSRDTLIILRQGYRRPIPDWDENFESRFRYKKMTVKIGNSSFGSGLKARAFLDVVRDALGRA